MDPRQGNRHHHHHILYHHILETRNNPQQLATFLRPITPADTTMAIAKVCRMLRHPDERMGSADVTLDRVWLTIRDPPDPLNPPPPEPEEAATAIGARARKAVPMAESGGRRVNVDVPVRVLGTLSAFPPAPTPTKVSPRPTARCLCRPISPTISPTNPPRAPFAAPSMQSASSHGARSRHAGL